MNQHICYENIALIGDAAGTTYYSFGAGTPMALNSAHTLSVAIKQNGTIDTALQQYAAHHLPTLHAIQKASLRDQAAMEHLESLQPLHPASFAYAFANRFEDMNPGTVPD
jgi:anthraniloyl-CoA monooxygenase